VWEYKGIDEFPCYVAAQSSKGHSTAFIFKPFVDENDISEYPTDSHHVL
jgi:hypothetical protein